MRARSWQQRERDTTRGRAGRFSKLNPCQLCAKSAGAEYCSDDRCNAPENDGFGLILCEKCCLKCSKLSDVEFTQLAKEKTSSAAESGRSGES